MGLFSRNNSNNSSDLPDLPELPQAKVIAFLNQKGGVGKTTMCFNTAHALREKGHRVLCLDMDPQSNLSLLFGVDLAEEEQVTYSIFNLLVNNVRELKALHVPALAQDVKRSADGIDLIPAGQELSGFELTVSGISAPRPLILKRFLEKSGLIHDYDYIVIDGPPTLGLLVVNILCAADGVIIPFRPDEFSRKGLGHFYDVLEEIEDMGIVTSPDIIAHVPNLVDARRKQEGNDLKAIVHEIEEIGEGTLVEPFYNRAPLVKSQAAKRSVFHFKSKEFEPLQKQFSELAGLIHQWGEQQ